MADVGHTALRLPEADRLNAQVSVRLMQLGPR